MVVFGLLAIAAASGAAFAVKGELQAATPVDAELPHRIVHISQCLAKRR